MRFFIFFTVVLIIRSVTAQADVVISHTDSLFAPAEAGDRNYQFEIARRYADGNGIRRDYRKAVYWLKRSAEQGHTEARFYLGWLYLHGKGVPENRKEALYWLELAAQENDAYAQYLTGNIYEEGISQDALFPADSGKAKQWYRRACGNHIVLACDRMNRMKVTDQ